MTDSAPKSRLPSTGTLVLIAMVLLVGGGALTVWLPYHREQQLIAEVERLGGEATTGTVRPLWYPEAADAGGFWLFEKVRNLDLRNTGVSDDGLANLRGLTNLRMLFVDGTQISDVGLEHLRESTDVWGLSLAQTLVTDKGLEHLTGLTNLELLLLDGTLVSDAGLEQLQGMNNLGQLSLDDTQVTDAGVEHLRGLINLRILMLRNTQVTQAGIEKLHRALPDCRIEWTPPSE